MTFQKFDTSTPLTEAERSMLTRLDFRPVIGVTGQERTEALQSLARRGLAKCWPGDGADRGVLLGCKVKTPPRLVFGGPEGAA